MCFPGRDYSLSRDVEIDWDTVPRAGVSCQLQPQLQNYWIWLVVLRLMSLPSPPFLNSLLEYWYVCPAAACFFPAVFQIPGLSVRCV